MNIEQCMAEIMELKNTVSSLEKRVKYLEKLLDDKDHDLFEKWFKRFLDDKCYGGW